MSVYIKGMEMPTNCGVCRFAGTCGVHNSEEWPDLESIIFNDVIGRNGVRDPDCPLVPVPKHGDLVERDDAETIAYMEEDVGRDFADGILFAADWIRQQPTIIPASEEGET